MEETRKQLVKEFDKTKDKKEFYSENISRIWRIWTVVHNEEGGYVENDYKIILYNDKCIGISEVMRESVFLNENETKALYKILKEIFENE